MDATRSRRTRDCARQRWYAAWRCQRFARHLGFASLGAATPDTLAPRPYASAQALTPAEGLEGNYGWELLLCSS